jgi:hypothetical protein
LRIDHQRSAGGLSGKALSLDIKIGGSLWNALALTPLSHSSIYRQIEEWESGVKAKALQSFALIHA